MSLVLEALKKQEAGSDAGAAVSLARHADLRRRHRLWAGLFAAAMGLNAIVLFWVFGLPALQRPESSEATAQALPQDTSPAGATAVGNAEPRLPVPAQRLPDPGGSGDVAGRTPATASVATDTPADPMPAASPDARPATPTRISLDKLSTGARSRFPGIAFSTHIYAEDPDLRAIVANGQRLVEGDRIRGLEILEITETGVVLAFERYAVEVPIVSDWDN